MTSSLKGLMTYSCAPAASARTMFACSLSVVTIMSDMSRNSSRARTLLMNVRPSITGMFQSTSATSGRRPASSWSSAS